MPDRFRTTSEEQTIALGERLAATLPSKCVVLLIGNLGAGKTTLAKGIVEGLGAASPDEVSSPTFTLIHEYSASVYHIDLYRLDDPQSVARLGLEELFDRHAVVLIEWGERFPELLPAERIEIRLTRTADESREIEVNRYSPAIETPEEYSARLRSYVGDKDPIAMQRDTPRILASLIEGVPDEVLSQQPAPGKWSVRAILAHMAEDELVSSWRYRQMIENSGATLSGFDQDEWARLGDYESWTGSAALELFRLLREANLRMFARLTPEEWQRCGIHAERGRITVEDLARHMAAHDVNHLIQVRRLVGKV